MTQAITTTQHHANIIVQSALEEMSRKSGVDIGTILSTMMATPDGKAARMFRQYIALGRVACGYSASDAVAA